MNDDQVAISLVNSATRLMVGMVILLAVSLGAQMFFDPGHKPDPTLTTMLAGVVGAISQNWGAAFNYKFGSTAQSKTKDETIQAQAATLAKTTGSNGDTKETN